MAKSSSDGLVGRTVEIFLKTPLFPFRYKDGREEKTLMSDVVRVSGDVAFENGAGMLLRVAEMSNLRSREREFPFDDIYLPFSKIDFMVLHSDD